MHDAITCSNDESLLPEERLQRQMDALAVWCNMMLRTENESEVIDFGQTKQGSLLNKISAV
uniref:Calponin-homology (CH) domain-containing protein n=1 Tax=Heterorhabditis bacteriophora TaxID=37862 RepID=A0A1I7XSH9_HETBA